jgi:hypothetical protein
MRIEIHSCGFLFSLNINKNQAMITVDKINQSQNKKAGSYLPAFLFKLYD